MFEGLPALWQSNTNSLLITKTGHLKNANLPPKVTAIETSHPIPDRSSLAAGQMALDFISSCPRSARLLVLVSGGASSLVEALEDPYALEDLQSLTNSALSAGLTISEINAKRKNISRIKGGRLFEHFQGASATTLAISDVEGDEIGTIGSGIGAPHASASIPHQSFIIASNAAARRAVAHAAMNQKITVQHNEETLYGDVDEVCERILKVVSDGPEGLYIFGGEPTIKLPRNPGKGGRNQALALMLAQKFQSRQGISGLVAGTDGTDGPTNAAGGFFDGTSFQRAPNAQHALSSANSAQALELSGDQIITGPTGTNVMDLAIILKTHGRNDE